MATRLPLSDVKVLDFMWVLAGPGITRSMADYGATVIRIESTNRRRSHPHRRALQGQ